MPTSSPGARAAGDSGATEPIEATDSIDAGWGEDEPEDAIPPAPAPTVTVGGAAAEDTLAAAAPKQEGEREGETEGESERITAPPPMPESEYVAAMMGNVDEGRGEAAATPAAPAIPRAATVPNFGAGRAAPAAPRRPPARPPRPPARPPRPGAPGGELGWPEIEAVEVDASGMDALELEALGAGELAYDPEDPDAAPTATALPGEIEELHAVEIDDDALVEEVRRLEFDLSETVEAPIYEPEGVREVIGKIADRIGAEDYPGALILAEGVLEEAPYHPRALAYAELCRAKLRSMYLSRLGEVSQVPALVGSRSELKELLDERGAADLLVRIDGRSSLEAVLRGSNVPELDALRLLFELVQQGVVTLRRRA